MKIEGGYYIKARKIQNSEIAHAPPHVREIWDWLLKEANHKDNGNIKRGQMVRSYKDIQNGLLWKIGYRTERYSKNHCEITMRWLTKRLMIHTEKTTRGMVITIINYDTYQNPNNYETYNETYKKHTRRIQSVDTINKNDNNGNNDKNVKNTTTTFVANDKIVFNKNTLCLENISDAILEKIKETYPAVDIEPEIKRMEIWITANPKNTKSNYLRFINNWLSRSQDKARTFPKTREQEDKETFERLKTELGDRI